MTGHIRECTREECPICGHRDWCGRREDGLVLCRRPPTPREVPGFTFKGMAKDGTTGMYVESGREYVQPRAAHPAGESHRHEISRVNDSSQAGEPNSGDRVDPKWLTANYPRLLGNMTENRRAALAETLSLPVSALAALAIGWWSERRWWNPETQQHEGEPGCWTFPEYDAHDRIIGLGLRWPTGRKGQMPGGRRGLILPDGWRELGDPVLIVEGPSDVLAGRALGLNVVGRPNNTGGAALLAQVCRNRCVIVLGENDRKPDGCWPGQEGADAIAGKLREAWGWPVPVAYPPDAQKDLRAWAVAHFATVGRMPDDEDLAAIRARFLEAVQPPAMLLMAGPRTRRGGKVSVKTFRWSQLADTGAFYSDKLDLDSARARARFAATVAELEPTVDPAELERRLLELHVPEIPRQRAVVASDSVPSAGAVMPVVSGVSGRPRIQGNERQLRDIRNDALAALIKANSPFRLFSRAGGIARIVLMPNEQQEITPCIQQLDADALRGELTNAADWFTLKHTKEGDFQVSDVPPLMVARDVLALPSIDLPPLIAIITCPTFARDGGLIAADGYDGASRLWHHLTLADLPAIPDSPTSGEIAAARNAFLDLLADFPFVDSSSRANAIALMLLPFLRPLIDGPTPLHAVDAPTAGTGKDLLVKATLLPALGYAVGVMTAAKDPDEWRKKISSALVAGNPAIVWGNIAQRLDSEHLAAVLTDVVWKDRQLGQTRELTLPNLAVWCCTGNNLSFSKELARRVVWIRLDAKVEAPEQRTGFRHPNLVAHVRQQRSALVAAALTLGRAWLAAGRPKGRQCMGSFESYAETVGGIFNVAGIEGFLANADELRRQADTETSEWRAFVHAWWDRWHDALVGVSDLSELLWKDGQRSDLLFSVVRSETQRGAVTQLGMRLARKRDCIIAGLRVVIGDKTDHRDRLVYRLLPTFPGPPEGRHEVGTKVGDSNSHAGNELGVNADLCRPSGDPLPYTCASNTHAHETRAISFPAGSRSNGKRSAKVGVGTQPIVEAQVTRADLGADLPPTFGQDVERSAFTMPPASPSGSATVRWYAGNGDHLPPTVRELAQYRDGWTPGAWRDRLLQLADRCADLYPERAAELRMAAAEMTHEKQGGCDVQREA